MGEHDSLGVIRALPGALLQLLLRLDLEHLIGRGLILDLGELAELVVADELPRKRSELPRPTPMREVVSRTVTQPPGWFAARRRSAGRRPRTADQATSATARPVVTAALANRLALVCLVSPPVCQTLVTLGLSAMPKAG